MTNIKTKNPFLLAILAGMLVLAFFVLKPFLATLVLAVICAVVLHPVYKKILGLIGGHEATATSITVILSIICIIIPLTFLGTQVAREAAQLYGNFSQVDDKQNGLVIIINNIGQTSEKIIPGTEDYFTNISNNTTLYIKQVLSWMIGNLGQALSGASVFLLDLFIFFISFYYLLKDGERLKKSIIKLSPLNDTDDETVFKRLESAVNSIIKGNLVIAFLQGILMTIGFYLFGLPNGLLWGSVAIIASLVPRIGTAIVLVPAVFYLFAIGNTTPAIGLAIWGTLIVGLVDNILGPKLIGKHLQLHPLFVLLSVLGGLVLFGPIGIFLGPLVMSLLFALLSVYSGTQS
ncbi:TPA: hypothetical protein DEP94_03085 [Candidatus Nomurabacteria bacterium]|nr:hypothetical protein [Candidatus Nomurabacteria bacterium]